jgi:hypothetical protein
MDYATLINLSTASKAIANNLKIDIKCEYGTSIP